MAAAIVPCETTPSAADELGRCSCGKEMQSPKLLDCLHVLGSCCTGALDGEEKTKGKVLPKKPRIGQTLRYPARIVVTCTVCGVETGVPDGKLQLLPDPNFLLLLVTAENKSQGKNPSCEQCDSSDHEATGRCQQCAQFICAKAIGVHKHAPVLKSHNIVELDEVSNDVSLESNCRKHQQLLELFCTNHKVPMCSKCKVKDHPSCKHVELDERLQEVTTFLKDAEHQLAGTTKSIRESLLGGSQVQGSAFQQGATELEQGVASYLVQEEFLLRRTTQMLKSGSKEEQLMLHRHLQKPRKIDSVFKKNIVGGELWLLAVNTSVDVKKIQPCVLSDDLSDEAKSKHLKVGSLLLWPCYGLCRVTQVDVNGERWKLVRVHDNHDCGWQGKDSMWCWKLLEHYIPL